MLHCHSFGFVMWYLWYIQSLLTWEVGKNTIPQSHKMKIFFHSSKLQAWGHIHGQSKEGFHVRMGKVGFQSSARIRSESPCSGNQVWSVRSPVEGHWVSVSTWKGSPAGWGLHACKCGGGDRDGELGAHRSGDQISQYSKDNGRQVSHGGYQYVKRETKINLMVLDWNWSYWYKHTAFDRYRNRYISMHTYSLALVT